MMYLPITLLACTLSMVASNLRLEPHPEHLPSGIYVYRELAQDPQNPGSSLWVFGLQRRGMNLKETEVTLKSKSISTLSEAALDKTANEIIEADMEHQKEFEMFVTGHPEVLVVHDKTARLFSLKAGESPANGMRIFVDHSRDYLAVGTNLSVTFNLLGVGKMASVGELGAKFKSILSERKNRSLGDEPGLP